MIWNGLKKLMKRAPTEEPSPTIQTFEKGQSNTHAQTGTDPTYIFGNTDHSYV